MERILIFAGTTEGRKLAEYLKDFPVKTYLSVATEYGRESLDDSDYEVIIGRKNEGEIAAFLEIRNITKVIDATHPFAQLATKNIKAACDQKNVPYIRCLREHQKMDYQDNRQIIRVDSIATAVEYLKHTEGRIFVATGSKDLKLYTAIDNYRERCYARVLSTEDAVKESIRLGFEGRHLIAMQGPYSRELNVALLRHIGASYFVTKESGKTGGFEEKLEAAEDTEVKFIVIGRPEEEGLTFEEVCELLKKTL